MMLLTEIENTAKDPNKQKTKKKRNGDHCSQKHIEKKKGHST